VLLCLVTMTLGTPKKLPNTPNVCMAWILASEARGEPVEGQRAVMDTILNRMWQRKLTACETLKQPFQFSGYRQGMKLHVSKEDLQRVEKAHTMKPVAPSAEFFHNKSVKPKWAQDMVLVKTINGTKFYKSREK